MHTCPSNIAVYREDYCSNLLLDRHCHTYYEIIYVLKGSVNIDIEGQHILLVENSGIVIEPLRYQIISGNDCVYHRLILSFYKEKIPTEIRDIFCNNIGHNFVFRSDSLTQHCLKILQLHEEQNPVYQPLCDSIFTQLLYELAFYDAPAEFVPQTRRTERLQQIIAYIDNHLQKDISLEDVASYLGMSKSSVCHIFKDEMKTPLKQYILHKKIMYAKTLIQQGISPGKAAQACGYKNYASFYKSYLKIAGQVPCESK